MRTGPTWDLLAVVALLAPLAGLAAPLAGTSGRRSIVRIGRVGALVAVAAWTVGSAAAAAPEVGGFAPDRLAMAAGAGAALLAAVVAVDQRSGERPGIGAVLAPPAAALAGLVGGAVDPPTSLGWLEATLLVVAGATVAALAVLLAVGATPIRRAGMPVLAIAVAPALLLSLRGAAELADPAGAAGLLTVAAAAGLAVLAAVRPVGHGPIAASACLLVAAVATGPVPAARPWAALVAAGAVLVATGAGRWTLLALAPGVVAVATALADVPAAGAPLPVAHLAFGLALAVVVGGGVAAGLAAGVPGDERAGDHDGSVVDDDGDDAVLAVEARVVVAGLAGWLLLAPGSWRWAVADAEALAGWDRAAAVGAGAALIAGTAAHIARLAGRARRRDRARPVAAR